MARAPDDLDPSLWARPQEVLVPRRNWSNWPLSSSTGQRTPSSIDGRQCVMTSCHAARRRGEVVAARDDRLDAVGRVEAAQHSVVDPASCAPGRAGRSGRRRRGRRRRPVLSVSRCAPASTRPASASRPPGGIRHRGVTAERVADDHTAGRPREAPDRPSITSRHRSSVKPSPARPPWPGRSTQRHVDAPAQQRQLRRPLRAATGGSRGRGRGGHRTGSEDATMAA